MLWAVPLADNSKNRLNTLINCNKQHTKNIELQNRLCTCNGCAVGGGKCVDIMPLLIVFGVNDRSGFDNASRLGFVSSVRGEADGGGIFGGMYGFG